MGNEDYVRYLFQAFLGRDPEPAGLFHFTKVLDQGNDVRSVIDALVQSPEFREKSVPSHSIEQWNKVHLIGVISSALNLNTYLEITTTTTGGKYREAMDLSFARCMRLVYRTNSAPSRDKLPIDFLSESDDIEVPLAEIRRRSLSFDLIFVDAHHTYDCSARDLAAAYSLLKSGGVIVVHDCNPPTREVAAPEFYDGAWCGVTYRSFIDFCLGNPAIDYLTFNADYGCGIIMKPRSYIRALKNRLRARSQTELRLRWANAGRDFDSAFDMFDNNRETLLRLGGFAALRSNLNR